MARNCISDLWHQNQLAESHEKKGKSSKNRKNFDQNLSHWHNAMATGNINEAKDSAQTVEHEVASQLRGKVT
jgi:hypothetical protein